MIILYIYSKNVLEVEDSMENSALDILEEIKSGFVEEKEDLTKKLQLNKDQIYEIDRYVDSLIHNEEADYKVFSPRNIEDVYKEQINEKYVQKENIENENQYHYHRLNLINDKIEKIDSVIKKLNVRHGLNSLNIQEEDRQRIANELHDTSLQNLAHLVHTIELSSMFIDQDPIRAKLELATTSAQLKKVIDDIRETIFNLRPMSFDDLGLVKAIDDLSEKLKQSHKCSIVCEVDRIATNNNLLLVTIYRIIKECLENAVKHSSCSKVTLSVKSDEKKIDIVVVDDGKGFVPEEKLSIDNNHFGLRIMKERIELLGGTFTIHSIIDKGTEIRIELPMVG